MEPNSAFAPGDRMLMLALQCMPWLGGRYGLFSRASGVSAGGAGAVLPKPCELLAVVGKNVVGGSCSQVLYDRAVSSSREGKAFIAGVRRWCTARKGRSRP